MFYSKWNVEHKPPALPHAALSHSDKNKAHNFPLTSQSHRAVKLKTYFTGANENDSFLFLSVHRVGFMILVRLCCRSHNFQLHMWRRSVQTTEKVQSCVTVQTVGTCWCSLSRQASRHVSRFVCEPWGQVVSWWGAGGNVLCSALSEPEESATTQI